MKTILRYLNNNKRVLAWIFVTVAILGLLLLFKLGSLTGGLSAGEVTAATAPVGWHGIYHQPFYLPLKAVRSVIFVLFAQHGQTLTRLPNVLFGALAIIAFTWLIKLWHSTRTAVLAGLLFASGAWILHVSRLASFDVLYLWATPTLLLMNSLLQRNKRQPLLLYGSLLLWGLMLYIPSLVWFIALSIWLQRQTIVKAWQHFASWWQRTLYLLAVFIWLPLLAVHLRHFSNLITWLGLPSHWTSVPTLAKQLVGVPVHLFIRGPEYPNLWLGRAPLLDIFTLAMCLLGIYFYAVHWRAGRSRMLALWAALGIILIGLGGPVSLSLLIPLLYIGAATGIAYLLHEWMRIFPNNPLARGLGLGLITLAVVLSCTYNLRAYFVAWPHNQATNSVFKYHR
jgi:hypothetical protein